MIISRCPLRISLAGGSTDLDQFIDRFGEGMVVSFPCSLYTYIYIQKDRFGFNHDNSYVINYSKKEIEKNPNNIKNDIARESIIHFGIEPVSITFFSDIYSSGSGLASSSSYFNCINKAIAEYLGISANDREVCRATYFLEKKINPLVGQQDSYGCGISGLKQMCFTKSFLPSIEKINTKIFNDLFMFLIPTKVSRKSTQILKTIEFKDDRLLKLAKEMYDCLMSNDSHNFHSIIKEGWVRKKETSKLINKNQKIKNLDQLLDTDSDILSHRLCGAGNGGFFLIFTKDRFFQKYEAIPISIDNSGIRVNKII